MEQRAQVHIVKRATLTAWNLSLHRQVASFVLRDCQPAFLCQNIIAVYQPQRTEDLQQCFPSSDWSDWYDINYSSSLEESQICLSMLGFAIRHPNPCFGCWIRIEHLQKLEIISSRERTLRSSIIQSTQSSILIDSRLKQKRSESSRDLITSKDRILRFSQAEVPSHASLRPWIASRALPHSAAVVRSQKRSGTEAWPVVVRQC